MKNLITKLISILVIMLMILNSSLLLVISVAVDEMQKIIDESKISSIYELNMEKYVNYNVGEKQGTFVQTYLKTGIEYQEGQEYLPIEASYLIIKTPKVNDKYPESVEVIVKTTRATNGDENGKNVKYAYDKENGQLEILTENIADENGNIYTENVDGARDEYQLNLYYDADCYNGENVKRTLDFTGKLELKLKDDERDIRKSQEIVQNFEVAENISGLISTDVTTSDIYNGYINSNIQNNTEYRTEYTENMKIQVSYKEISDEININKKNLFINNESKEIETQDVVYKSTKVNKNEVLDKLGENGTLQIIDKDGNVLLNINKDTEADENGNVQVEYDSEKAELNFKLSKPVKLGDINIRNVKQIKDTMQDVNITKVETKNIISCVNNATEIKKVVDEETKEEKEIKTTNQVEVYNFTSTNVSEIKAAKTDVKVTADNTEWTNNMQNDVVFTATLVTAGPENSLFKNPVIDIKLPEEVEKVVLGESSILYDNRLQIGSVEVVEENYCKVIRVKINGTQTSYIKNEIVNGANIIIPASVILKKDIDALEEKITYLFTNYKDESAKLVEMGNAEISVNLISVVNNKVLTYQSKINDNGEMNSQNATSGVNTDEESKNVNLDRFSVEYKATLGKADLADGASVHENEYIKYIAKITNNTGENIEKLNVIASVPEGTTYVTVITRDLTVEDLENGIADECKIEEFPEIKQFSSVISLESGKQKEIYYYVRANNLEEGVESRNINSTIKLQAGKNEKEISTLSNVIKKAGITVSVTAWMTARTDNGWLYRVYVTNNKNESISDLKIKLDLEGKCILTDDKDNKGITQNGNTLEFFIDSIPGKKVDENVEDEEENLDGSDNVYVKNFFVKAKVKQDEPNVVDANALVECGEDIYYSRPNIQIIDGPVVNIIQTSTSEGEELKYGDEVEYVFSIKNETKAKIEFNINFYDYLDKNMKPISMEYENYFLAVDPNDDSIVTNEKQIIKETLSRSILDGDNEEICNKYLYIPNGEEAIIKIKATPMMIYKKVEVENYASLKYIYDKVEYSKISNTIKNTILPYDYNPDNPNPDNPNPDNPNPDNPNPDNPNPDNPNPDDPNPDDSNPDDPDSNDSNSNTYSISGTVWEDTDENGIRDTSEILLSGITVKLFNIDTNEIVVIDNNKQITKTNNNGEYKFSGIKKGNYIVLFEYDINKYKLTVYRSNAANEYTNSDVINKNVNIDGIEKIVGVTDTIKVSKQSESNIDMGLVVKKKYDFRLDKYITNVEVIYGEQKENYEYEKTKLAKVEVPVKKLNDAQVKIEYKIEIKNEGDVDAIVEEIVDYKPEGLEFEKNLNNNWAMDENSNLKCYSLAGKKLKPGETTNVILYLTKKISKDTMGTFTNSAEILKSSNLMNLKDIDSTEGNKDKSEDDYSEAQIIISVKTGRVLYVTIVLLVMLLIVGIIVLVKKNIIKLNKINTIALSFLATVILANVVFTNNSYAEIECWHSSSSTDSLSTVKVGDKTFYTHNYYSHDYYLSHSWNDLTKKLFCTDGGAMGFVYKSSSSVSQKFKYYYKETEKKDSSTSYGDWTGSGASIQNKSSSSSTTIKGDYYIIGPFKVEFNGSLNAYKVEGTKANGTIEQIIDVKICNSDGKDISITSGNDFYIKISKSVDFVKINKIVLENKTTQSRKKTTSYRSQEKWITNDIKLKSDGSVKDEIPQVLGYFNVEKDSTEETENKDSIASVEINISKSLLGNIKIAKKDKDNTTISLAGATFQVTGPNNYDKTHTTGTDGTVTISNIPLGTYTIKETGAPTNYNIDLQEDTTKTITVTGGTTATATINNKQYGNLKVIKYDEDTGNTSIGGNKLQGIQFKLYIMKNGTKQYLRNATLTKYAYSDFKVNEANKSTAKTFTTDLNAQFTVDNLPVYEGKEKITYYIEEYALPSNLQDYYNVKTTADTIEISNGKTTTKNVTNKQQYIKISGFVWEDKKPGINSLRNDLYDSQNNEPLVSGITVRLKDKQNNGAIVQETKTDSNGKYTLKNVNIDKLSNYYVEFEYNGLKYESVKYKNQSNGSKAIESNVARTDFNNSFATIIGGNEKQNETIGYSKNTSGTVSNELKYKNGEYSSSLVQNTGYTVEKTKESVIAKNGSTGAAIKASTDVSGYSLNTWKSGIAEIENINLGIYEREQPDMAVATDIDNIQFSINGYTHTYNYKQREDYIKNEIADVNLNPGYDATKDGFNVYTKNKTTGKYKDMTYARAIYDSYIAYTKKYPERNNKLRVFVTYKLVVKNESRELVSRVSLKNNADKRYYRVEESYYSNDNNSKTSVTWNKVQNKDGVWQTKELEKDIKPSEYLVIYLKYELSTDTVTQLANLDVGKGLKLDKNVTEISSYSTWKDGKVYGGIDKDSAPGNIAYNKISTYEDDTDTAPDLEIKRKESKKISGLVFEDSTDSKLMTAQERKGNGTYEKSTDKTVKDVDIQIIDYNNRNTIKLYSLDDRGNAIEREAQAYTDNNGEYSFVGLIPGEYYIQYIYGSYKDNNGNTKQTVIKSGNSDISVTTQDYKSTIVDDNKFKTLIENNIEKENGYNAIKADFDKKKNTNALWYWYQNTNNSTNSSAVDYSEWRSMINKQLENIDYSVKNTYDNKLDIAKDATNAKYYYMIANTGIMDIPIEDIRNQVTDYDYKEGQRNYQIKFGIVERPRQSVQVNKEISYLRLVLVNGQILAQGDPRNEKINYVTYPQGGSLKLEIDNEIVKGSILNLDYEITVENKSELDYDDINYYRYGKNYDKSKLVKIKLDSIVDYVDQKMSVTYDMGTQGSDFVYYNSSNTITDRWQLIQDPSAEPYKLAGIDIDTNIYRDIKNRSNIVVRNTNIEISPLDIEKTKFYITTKKLLTDINGEDQIFDNYAELIKVSNSVGRFYGQMNNNLWILGTPGNFNVTEIAEADEYDNSGYARKITRSAQMVIIPPTGGKPTAMYYIIGISCLLILTVGIILIKKKVLD